MLFWRDTRSKPAIAKFFAVRKNCIFPDIFRTQFKNHFSSKICILVCSIKLSQYSTSVQSAGFELLTHLHISITDDLYEI